MRSVKMKIFLPISIMGCIFFLFVAMQYCAQQENINRVEQLSSVSYESVVLAENLKLSVVQIQQWLTDISATRAAEGLDDGFDEAEVYFQQANAITNELLQINPQHTEQLKEIQSRLVPYYETGKKMAQAYIDKGPEGGNRMMGEFDTTSASINEAVDALKEEMLAEAQLAVESTKSKAKESILTGQILFLVVLAVYLFTLFFISYMVVRPIRLILKKLKSMAENSGDLTQKIDYKAKDEIGALAENFNKMQENFRVLIQQVIQISNHASASMEQTGKSVSVGLDLSQKMNEQSSFIAGNMEENASSIEEMSTTTQDITQRLDAIVTNAKEQAENSGVIRKRAEKLRETAITSMNQMKKLNQETKEKLDVAMVNAKAVEQITSLTNAIADIASQTNLLALNASIEAARAGEAGKGFAVVASEINSLASNSGKVAEEIRSMNEKTLLTVNELVDTLKEIFDYINEVVIKDYENTVTIGEKYNEDANMFYHVTDDISKTSDEILVSMNAMATTMQSVAEITGQSAEGTSSISQNVELMNGHFENIESLSNGLAKQTKRLQGLVDKYVV